MLLERVEHAGREGGGTGKVWKEEEEEVVREELLYPGSGSRLWSDASKLM